MNCYKTKFGEIEDRNMDEHIILSSGKVIEMKNDCLHFDFKNLEYFVNKHNWYSSRETVDYFENLENAKAKSEVDAKSWFKMNVYYKLPIGFSIAFILSISILYKIRAFLYAPNCRIYNPIRNEIRSGKARIPFRSWYYRAIFSSSFRASSSFGFSASVCKASRTQFRICACRIC